MSASRTDTRSLRGKSPSSAWSGEGLGLGSPPPAHSAPPGRTREGVPRRGGDNGPNRPGDPDPPLSGLLPPMCGRREPRTPEPQPTPGGETRRPADRYFSEMEGQTLLGQSAARGGKECEDHRGPAVRPSGLCGKLRCGDSGVAARSWLGLPHTAPPRGQETGSTALQARRVGRGAAGRAGLSGSLSQNHPGLAAPVVGGHLWWPLYQLVTVPTRLSHQESLGLGWKGWILEPPPHPDCTGGVTTPHVLLSSA